VRTADRIGAAILLALAVAYTATAVGRYTYWTATGPGAGFFPFWLGLVLALLSSLMLVSAVRQPDAGAAWLPTGHGAARFVVVVVVTGLFIALLPLLGMVLGTALFLGVLLRMLEGHSWRATLAVAVGAAVANWALFVQWLKVPFPVGVLGF
jgi:putative tricarboxylic transport membrane protein